MLKCARHMPGRARGVHGACTGRATYKPINLLLGSLGSARRPAAGKHPGRIRGPDARGPCGGITSRVGVPVGPPRPLFYPPKGAFTVAL